MRQALTFLATIENDHPSMKTLAVIAILALLAISGAAYTDALDQRSARKGRIELDLLRRFFTLGDVTMLSVDQFLRLISLPAVVAAFLIASQISGGLTPQSPQFQLASE
jgi:hypothetical protein